MLLPPTAPSIVVTPAVQDQSIDLKGLMALLRRQRGKIVSTTLLGLAASVAFLLTTARVYTSSATLYIDPRPNRVVSEDTSIPGSTGSDLAIVDSQIPIIGSDKLLGQVVDKLGLVDDIEFAPPPGPVSRLKNIMGQGVQMPNAPRVRAIQAVGRQLKLKRATKTYIVDMELSASSPEKAALVLQAIIDAYMAEQAGAKQLKARQTSEVIDSRLSQLQEQVRLADTKVDEFRKANKIVVSEGGITSEQQLTRLNAELVAARTVTATAKAHVEQVERAVAGGGSPEAIPEAVRSNVILRLRDQYAQVARREAILSSQLLPQHPTMVETQSQLAAIKGQIAAELKRIVASLRLEYHSALDRQNEIERTIDTARTEVERTSSALVKLRSLEQDARASREVLQSFLARSRETREQENTALADARIVSAPSVPISPSRPIPMLVLALGGLGGLGLGLARALAASQPKGALQNSMEVRAAAGVQTLASLPVLEPARQGFRRGAEPVHFCDMLEALAGNSRGRQQTYRRSVLWLLARLRNLCHGDQGATIMLVGAHAGAGTSATALALAYAAAKNNGRTLLIDASAADAELSLMPAGDSVADWGRIVSGRKPLGAAVIVDPGSGLELLPLALAGLRGLKTAERRHLASLVRTLARDYDLVFIDAGAPVEDPQALLLLPAATTVVLVARAGVTSAAAIAETVRRVQIADGSAAGVVLTMARDSDTAGAGPV